MAKKSDDKYAVGLQECGCIVSVLALGIASKTEEAKTISEMFENGLMVRTVTRAEYEKLTWEFACPHKRKTTKPTPEEIERDYWPCACLKRARERYAESHIETTPHTMLKFRGWTLRPIGYPLAWNNAEHYGNGFCFTDFALQFERSRDTAELLAAVDEILKGCE